MCLNIVWAVTNHPEMWIYWQNSAVLMSACDEEYTQDRKEKERERVIQDSCFDRRSRMRERASIGLDADEAEDMFWNSPIETRRIRAISIG